MASFLSKYKYYQYNEWLKFIKKQRFIALIPEQEKDTNTLFIVSGKRAGHMKYNKTIDNNYVVSFLVDDNKKFIYPKKFSCKEELLNFSRFISNVLAGCLTLGTEDWCDQFPEYKQVEILEII